MLVDIDWILNVDKRLSEINRCKLEDIKWVKDGKEVAFDTDDLDEWCFTGLNNVDIIYNRTFIPVDE